MFGVLRWLLVQRFDVVYDLQGSERSAVMTIASRARKRVGMGIRAPYTHHISFAGYEHEHIFDRLNRLLSCAGLEPAEPRPKLYAGVAERERLRAWLSGHALEERSFVLMHAGSSARWRSKRWPCFPELSAALRREGIETVWIGGEEDREVNGALAKGGGVDARPMHVLSASGIPVYAFFGPTDWQRHHAVGQASRVLRGAAPCSPCYLGECPPERGHACLRSISVDQVMARLRADGLIGRAPDSE